MKFKKPVVCLLVGSLALHPLLSMGSSSRDIALVAEGVWRAGRTASPAVKAFLPGASSEVSGDFDSRLVDISRFHNQQMNSHAVATSLLRTNQEIFNWIVDASIVVAAPTGVGLAVGLGVKYSVDQAMDALHDHVSDSLKESARNHLAYGLEQYTRENADRNLRGLTDLPADQIYEHLFGSDSAAEKNKLFSGLDEESYRVLQQQIQTELELNLSANTLQDLARDKVTREALSRQHEDLTKLRTEFKNYQTQSTTRLENLAAQTGYLQKDVELLKKETGKNSAAIAAVSDFLYSKAKPSEQIKLLDNPAFMPDLVGPARERAKSIAERKKFIEETAGQYLNAVGDIAKIAQGLGFLKPKQAAKVARAVSFAQNAVSLAANIMSQNYFGALSVAGGILGGGGSSRDEEMHRKLDQIIQTLGIMDQKLDHIIQLQEHTIKMIAALHNDLRDFREAFELSHLAVMDRLQMIENRQILSNRMLGELSYAGMRHCESFLNHREQYGYAQFPDGSFRFPGQSGVVFEKNDFGLPVPRSVGLEPLLSEQMKSLQTCFGESGLQEAFGRNKNPKEFLNLSLEERGILGSLDSKRKQIDATIEFLKISEDPANPREEDENLLQNLVKLSVPSAQMQQIARKDQTEVQWKKDLKNEVEQLARQHILPGSTGWLSSEAVESAVQTLIEVLPYDEFMSEDRRELRPFGVVGRSRTKWGVHWSYLAMAEKWIQLARLQHNLVVGDVLLPKAERVLLGTSKDAQTVQVKALAELLKANPLFKLNLMKWIVSQNLQNQEGKDFVMAYARAADLKDVAQLDPRFKSFHVESRRTELVRIMRQGMNRRGLNHFQDLDIQYRDNGTPRFVLVLLKGAFEIELPSADELYKDSHFLNEEVLRLNRISQKLFDVKSDYLYQSWSQLEGAEYVKYREMAESYQSIRRGGL